MIQYWEGLQHPSLLVPRQIEKKNTKTLYLKQECAQPLIGKLIQVKFGVGHPPKLQSEARSCLLAIQTMEISVKLQNKMAHTNLNQRIILLMVVACMHQNNLITMFLLIVTL